ncbi:CBS domain-containing protein [Neiella marina]|uniref:CBS domain-containing protein n=1 Tax=Neiella holothuriorum TaxID=2870530 RepID=A0ABS7EK51_9GAMM|nr:CBS domain-containing protein [Neiella holothuriorum]MBW8192723.1 CBS domain-containing protein [Neiella holothuriorum]
MTIQVNEIMNTNLFTLNPEASIAEAKKLMAAHPIRHIPIVDAQNRLLGVVSQRDVLSHGAMQSNDRDQANIATIMTDHPYSISPKTGVIQAARLLKRERFGCLPVVEQDILVGMVTGSDFVEVAIQLMTIAEETTPDPIDDL